MWLLKSRWTTNEASIHQCMTAKLSTSKMSGSPGLCLAHDLISLLRLSLLGAATWVARNIMASLRSWQAQQQRNKSCAVFLWNSGPLFWGKRRYFSGSRTWKRLSVARELTESPRSFRSLQGSGPRSPAYSPFTLSLSEKSSRMVR